MSNLNDAIRQFDATEANLRRLEEIWEEMEGLIPDGMVVDAASSNTARYAELGRTFRHIMKALPRLDGVALTDDLMDLDDIFQSRFDASEIGFVECHLSTEKAIYRQRETLGEYRFRFSSLRRGLVRDAIQKAIAAVDDCLCKLSTFEKGDLSTPVKSSAWDELKRIVAEIDVLRGTAIPVAPRWHDLHRHLSYGLLQDLTDIIKNDWPVIKPALKSALYGPSDPIPVEATDLGDIVKAAPEGRVTTALKWDVLDAEAFERLVYNLLREARGYTNTSWLMHTNAPDRGRDIEVRRVLHDELTGMRALRVIVQCKHWPRKGIGLSELSTLITQMQTWEPPKVDELIIATSGRFTVDAVKWVEDRNIKGDPPWVTMWPDSHVETLLAARPHLVAEFNLR